MKRALLVCLLLAACSQETPQPAAETPKPQAPPPPSAAAAKDVIANAAEFGDFEFTNAGYSLPMQRASLNEPQRTTVDDLVKAGWLRFDGDTLALTKKSEGDKRFLVRPNGTLDIVPLAKKEMGEVTAVESGSEGPVATFTWQWVPNEVGASIQSGPVAERLQGTQSGKATLLPDGTGWTVLRITR